MFQEQVLWHRHDDGAFVRAIPTIGVSGKGTLLAFSEARLGGEQEEVREDLMYDEIPSHLTLKRSTDGGVTWSPSAFIERSDGSWWAAEGSDKRESWSQATSVADARNGRVFVFYVLNEGEHKGENLQRYARVFVRSSDDEGVHWTERREITDELNCDPAGRGGPAGESAEGFAADHMGRAFHICLGHGTQLDTGRLLVPFWSRRSLAHRPADRGYGIKVLASDDRGAHWRVLAQLGTEYHLTESRIAQLDDGSLYMNARTDRPDICHLRVRVRSADRGETWSEPEPDRGFGAGYRSDAGLACQDGAVVLSKGSHPAERKRMAVSLSLDGGRSWAARRVVTEEAAYYSDLAALGSGLLGLIYLKGRLNRWRGHAGAFARFDMDWIRGGRTHG